MLNVNTAYKFDPNSKEQDDIDGKRQRQINLMALSWKPFHGDVYNQLSEQDLRMARANYGNDGLDPNDLKLYEDNVVWKYGNPIGGYTPFDISDELELRNRFLVNHKDIDARLEGWGGEFRNRWVPFRRHAMVRSTLTEWVVVARDRRSGNNDSKTGDSV